MLIYIYNYQLPLRHRPQYKTERMFEFIKTLDNFGLPRVSVDRRGFEEKEKGKEKLKWVILKFIKNNEETIDAALYKL